jgi:predicted phage terminase large subunit-like protein
VARLGGVFRRGGHGLGIEMNLEELALVDRMGLERELCESRLGIFTSKAWKTFDTSDYETNWHIDAINSHLTAVADRKIRKLLINVPPRTGKTNNVSVCFPAWLWTQNPGKDVHGQLRPTIPGTFRGPGVKIVGVSYAQRLSQNIALREMRLIQSQWYQDRWGDRVILEKITEPMFQNSVGGFRYSTSVNGGVLGEGGDIIIIDDPHNALELESEKSRDDAVTWWQEVISTRLNDQRTGAFIIVMQRLHDKDLTGHILAKEHGWDHLVLPMRYEINHPFHVRSSIGFKDPRTVEGELLWKDRLPEQVIVDLSERLKSYGTAGQLQQRPSPREGGMFKRAWFTDNMVDFSPVDGFRYRGWDLAASIDGDYLCGVLINKANDGVFYIEDVFRKRVEGLAVDIAIQKIAEKDTKKVRISLPQDPGSSGKIQALALIRMLAGWMVRATPESGDKATRATPFANQCEAGNVKLVRGRWCESFCDELASFPTGEFDDQVDAASRSFNALNERRRGVVLGLND